MHVWWSDPTDNHMKLKDGLSWQAPHVIELFSDTGAKIQYV
jgi:hypothetical protein